jgi:hypothetical protein
MLVENKSEPRITRIIGLHFLVLMQMIFICSGCPKSRIGRSVRSCRNVSSAFKLPFALASQIAAGFSQRIQKTKAPSFDRACISGII